MDCSTTNPLTPAASVSKSVSVKRAGQVVGASGAQVQPGDVLTWTVTVSNPTSVAYVGDLFTDDLSSTVAGTDFDPMGAGAFTVSPSGADVVLTPAASSVSAKTGTSGIAAGSSVTVSYSGTVLGQSVLNDNGITSIDNTVTSTTGTDCAAGACTTTNPLTPKVSVSKSVFDADGNDVDGQQVVAGEALTWSITVQNVSSVPYVGPLFTDDLTSTLAGTDLDASAITAPSGSGVSVSFTSPTLTGTATGLAAGATVTVQYTANVKDQAALIAGNIVTIDNTVVSTTGTDCTVDCSTTNPLTVTPSIAKTVSSTTQQADGTWTVVYDIAVTNPSELLATVYDVTDELAFGSGITVNSAGVTGPGASSSWDGDTDTTVASGQPLDAGAVAHYTVTVNATVASSTGTGAVPATECQPGEPGQPGQPGGFGNNSTVSLGSQPEEQPQLSLRSAGGALMAAIATVSEDGQHAYACSEPTLPTIQKKFVSALQNSNGTWNVTYTVTVANPSDDATLAYNLSDTPDFPASVTVNSASATLGGNDVGTWDAATLKDMATGKTLAPGASDVYTVVVNATVPLGLSADQRECSTESGPGHGFFNSATVTSGQNTLTADDCGNIPEVVVPNVTKTVSSLTQNADGTWTIVYDLTATNPSADQAATYDLSDTLHFGGGISIVSAAVTGPSGGAISGWTGVVPNTSIVIGRSLAPQAQEHYTVTVIASVASTSSSTDRDCTLQSGESGTGFLNTVGLTSGAYSSTDTACASPVSPEIVKSVVGTPTQNGDGSWTVTYQVTVSNPSISTALVYNLSDTPSFPQGVTITAASATFGGQPVGSWNGTSITGMATGKSLAPRGSDVYTVTITASVASNMSEDLRTCSDEGPGHGFYNEGTATSGEDTFSDSACVDIPPEIEVEPTSSSIEVLPTSQSIPPTTKTAEVLPTSKTTIAYTGVNAFGMGWVALLLLVGGALLVAVGTLRRRPRKH